MGKIKELEEKSELWEKTKGKATKMLWWDDVVEELAKQSQQTEQSDTETEKDKTEDSSKQQTETSSTPATLSQNGEVWFMHPVALMNYFKFKAGIVTYHIYQDGKIEKHIPEKISPGFERKYQYVYHDKHKNEHEICICEWHTINKKKFVDSPRETFNYPDHGTVEETKTNVSDGYIAARAKYKNGDIHEWIKIEEGVSIYERLTMTNGNIAEYGRHDKQGDVWKLYEKLKEEAQMVRMPDSLNYESSGVIIKYELKETFRKYINPDLLAGFIGALAEIKENIIVTGSAYEQGSCFPSSLHINGLSIDTKYIKKVKNLTDYKKDKEFVNALAKFHFRTFRVGKEIYNLFKDISGTKNGGDLHNSHLHTENFDFNTIKIIE